MHTLRNDHLAVDLLDPVADRDRLGPRYCTGGYVFQVHDARHGPVLAGPTYPHDVNWFDGQGIPDAFNLAPLRDPASTEPVALVVGVGTCDLARNVVLEHCAWEIDRAATPDGGSLTYRTTHDFQGFTVALERDVRLHGRTLTSETRVRNRGERLVPISWFPHPFYPQPEDGELFRTNLPVGMPENEGYEIAPNGFVRRRRLLPGHQGDYQALDLHASAPAFFAQRHPALGLVTMSTSYVPSFLPIWGNHHTFSFEPFLERSVATGQAAEWTVRYDF